MRSWRGHLNVRYEEAQFEVDRKELRLTDSPETYGWLASLGTLVVRAIPRVLAL